MNITSENHYQEIKNKYEGKSIVEKDSGDKFKIMSVGMNTYCQNENKKQFAIALLEPIEMKQTFAYNEPPSIDFVLRHFEILD